MLKLLSLILVTVLVFHVDGSKCKLNDKRLEKRTAFFQNKCLKKGFESSLSGCQSEGSQDDLKKKRIRKCRRVALTKNKVNLNLYPLFLFAKGPYFASVACCTSYRVLVPRHILQLEAF